MNLMMFVQLLINTTFYYISVFERKKKLYIKLLFPFKYGYVIKCSVN